MIRIEKANILEVKSEALVNSVNLKGVMGKGIALAFKNAFPANFELYKKACKSGEINIGKIFVTETGPATGGFPKYIINFPTKKDWKYPSKYEYIEKGLTDLVNWLKINKVKSIAIPPLGSGNGKLEWQKVKGIILRHLNELKENIDIIIIEPSREFETIKIVQDKKVELTPARAMLLYLMERYKILGYEINFLVVQKLSYFLQRFNEPLRLRFEKGYYGPYAQNLIPLLNHLNGVYISFNAKNENKPSTVIKSINSKQNEVNDFVNNSLSPEQVERLQKVLELIRDFETPFGLELLGTIDFILNEKKSFIDTSNLLQELGNWTGRKKTLFKPHYLETALKRLSKYFSYV